ncbi:MAG: hypothetical protein LKJ29_00545 [Lactobacillus sp.]|uniref:Uncharacterized protein n=2 Tax=Lacticaseibacillus suilingensis TaxID=2799577 RepID=A0ABW4BFJ2_9LACO|nr:hypothetical protein [Lacticaseibacillus suilingensis]MCI1893333.1 hypothetical protein [Lactobacillus sp.]MCI1940518.1 hypothetical protein [Lactobacillus sp.]MCI2017865.1 hypothetical protein [Lactobacillus sp.]MCI2037580.1 hypothetical protein [Lactobacillus sp.]
MNQSSSKQAQRGQLTALKPGANGSETTAVSVAAAPEVMALLNEPQLITVLKLIISEVAPLDQARNVIEGLPLLKAFLDGPQLGGTISTRTTLAFATDNLHRLVAAQKQRLTKGIARELAAKATAQQEHETALQVELEELMFNRLGHKTLRLDAIRVDASQQYLIYDADSPEFTAFHFQGAPLDFGALLDEQVMTPYREHLSAYKRYQDYKNDFEQARSFAQYQMAQHAPAATSKPNLNEYLQDFYREWNAGPDGRFGAWFAQISDVRLRANWYELAQKEPADATLTSFYEELDETKIYHDGGSLGTLLVDRRRQLATELATIETNSAVHPLMAAYPELSASALVEHYFEPLQEEKLLLWYQMRTLHERLREAGRLGLNLMPAALQQGENRVSFYTGLIEALEAGRAVSWQGLLTWIQTDQGRRELPSLSQDEPRHFDDRERVQQCRQSWLTGWHCPELVSEFSPAGVEGFKEQIEAMTQAATAIASPEATFDLVAEAQAKILSLLASLDD